MKRLTFLSILVVLIAGLLVPSIAIAQDDGPIIDFSAQAGNPTIDIIALAEGSTTALVEHIRAMGGVIRFQYRNVPAVAAAIPLDKLGEVAGFSGVTSVEKDRLFYLTDDLAGGRNDQNPRSYAVEDMSGVQVKALDPATFDPADLPEGYANFMYTGAVDVWNDTGAGEGTIVAVVDTGTAPNVCLSHAVIGAPGFPDGYNAVGDGIPATSPLNYWHGTHVAGVIASLCALDFTEAPDNPIYLAQAAYLGWPIDSVPVLGQAPEAQIYPVKVFPADGSGVPSSVILDGLDHVLTLKKEGLLDIDIVNMSLGGPTVWDGRDAYDRFIMELSAAKILVVTSAGNEGPTLNSVGSPATAFGAVSVGALDYAPSSRVLYEYLGLRYLGAAGQGMVMRPTDETRVANFSSRGPLSDGRTGPDISALGQWTFFVGPNDELRWAGGTSFSSPTVAGGAALLNAWWEAQGNETAPTFLKNVLLRGANPDAVGASWQGLNNQGYGALDVPSALDRLMAGDWNFTAAWGWHPLRATVLGWPFRGRDQTWESESITLAPSEPFDAVFEIGYWTSKVTIEIFDIVAPDNSDYAYWPNALEVHVQSAKRTAFDDPVAVYWYPYWYGDAFDIVIEDGPWTVAGGAWDYQPMENGLMKLSLISDYSNEAPVSFKVRITRENNRQLLPWKNRIASGLIRNGDSTVIPVEIPEGTTTATFDLTWLRDWSKFPTSDIDMIIYDPDFGLYSIDGATGNAPERAIISEPQAGTWYVLVDGYEVYRPDYYGLYLALE